MSHRFMTRPAMAILVLALISAVAVSGCGTPGTARPAAGQFLSPRPDVCGEQQDVKESGRFRLSQKEKDFAECLAHYCYGLILDISEPESRETTAEFERILELDPERADIALRLARQYHSLGQDQDAMRVLQNASTRSPWDYNSRLFLADIYQYAGNSKKAEEEYSHLVKIEPHRSDGYISLAKVHLAQHDEAKAFQILREGLAKAENAQTIGVVCQILGRQYILLNRLSQSIECLEIAFEGCRDQETALLLSACYLTAGKTGEGLKILQNVPAAQRDNPRFQCAVAEMLMKAGQYDEAAAAFEKVEKLPDDSGETADRVLNSRFYYGYGAACERIGQLEKAEKLLEKSIELDAACGDAYNYIAYTWAEHGINLEKGLKYVLKALEFEPDNAAFIDTLGWIYYKQKDYDKALDQIEKAYRLMPDDPTIADHLGDIFNVRRQFDQALTHWKRSFLLNPADETVKNKLKDHGVDIERLRAEAEEKKTTPEKTDESGNEGNE